MQSSLAWQIQQGDAATKVVLSGEITENTDFNGLLSHLSAAALVLDLAEVRRINSCGVREWIHFVSALRSSGKTLELERCSVPIVNQMNMISNFRGNARVRSVYAPYFCPECDAERLQLIELSGEAKIDETMACPECGAKMEFDDLPDQFLAFNSG